MVWYICICAVLNAVLNSAFFAVLAAVPQMIYTHYGENKNLLSEDDAKAFCAKSEKFSELYKEYKNLLREYGRGPEDNSDYTGAQFGKIVLVMSYLVCCILQYFLGDMVSTFLAVATVVLSVGTVVAILLRVCKFRRDYINYYSGNLETLNTRFMRIFEEQIEKVSYFEHDYHQKKIETTDSACDLIAYRISALRWLTRMDFKYHTYWLGVSIFGMLCTIIQIIIFLNVI